MTEKLYLDYKAVENHVTKIGREILLSSWHPDIIVGLTRGGLLPATLLSQYLQVPMTALDVSLRDNSAIPNESCAWLADDALGKRTNILVVDDINDTGATIEWIIEDWQRSARPQSPEWNHVWGDSVRFAVVVDNESSNYKECSYSGLDINKFEKDVWVVFPWEDWWLNKPE